MKLLIPAGWLFPSGWGNVNNNLRSEKVLSSCLRTWVRFPSAPPYGYYANPYYFFGGIAIKVPFDRNANKKKKPSSWWTGFLFLLIIFFIIVIVICRLDYFYFVLSLESLVFLKPRFIIIFPVLCREKIFHIEHLVLCKCFELSVNAFAVYRINEFFTDKFNLSSK